METSTAPCRGDTKKRATKDKSPKKGEKPPIGENEATPRVTEKVVGRLPTGDMEDLTIRHPARTPEEEEERRADEEENDA